MILLKINIYYTYGWVGIATKFKPSPAARKPLPSSLQIGAKQGGHCLNPTHYPLYSIEEILTVVLNRM